MEASRQKQMEKFQEEKMLQYSTARAWCLLSLTGMAMSAVILLNEGQARPSYTPPSIQSVKFQNTHATRNTASIEDPSFQPTTFTHSLEIAARGMNIQEKNQKKKFGLAILFLGVLAEKS